MKQAVVTLNRTGARRLQSGHPWIYRQNLKDPVPAAPGVVRIQDDRGKDLGVGLFSPKSRIPVRALSREIVPIDDAFFIERFRRAREYRDSLGLMGTGRREVFAESDGLPSLIVDRYDNHLVLQCLSAGMETLRSSIVTGLLEVYEPASILGRNDPSVRTLEGLPRAVESWFGDTPANLTYREGALTFEVNPHEGQKTGAYLDQSENHAVAAACTKGRVLDAFSYHGGFALPMASNATHVTAVDSSKPALDVLMRNAERNGIENIRAVESNVFDYLKSAEKHGDKFDTIVLDPPAFAKNRSEVEAGLRGYKDINLRAMKILYPGGRLITCSCSYHAMEGHFVQVIEEAAADVGRRFRLVEKRTQGRDHPLLIGFPESYYLKCLILELLD